MIATGLIASVLVGLWTVDDNDGWWMWIPWLVAAACGVLLIFT